MLPETLSAESGYGEQEPQFYRVKEKYVLIRFSFRNRSYIKFLNFFFLTIYFWKGKVEILINILPLDIDGTQSLYNVNVYRYYTNSQA